MSDVERQLRVDLARALERARRAEGLFRAADAELNALKVKCGQVLLELEDARRELAGRQ